jgi:hypothetical protein
VRVLLSSIMGDKEVAKSSNSGLALGNELLSSCFDIMLSQAEQVLVLVYWCTRDNGVITRR